jgi:hypothetical protein
VLTSRVFLVVSAAVVSAATVYMTPLAGLATSGGTPGIAIDAAPRRDLGDGQTVTVSVRGFRPGQLVGVEQCPSPPGPNTEPPYTAQDCDPHADSSAGVSDYREGHADDRGEFQTAFLVRTHIRTADAKGVIDCAHQQCAVVAFLTEGDGDAYGYDDISFHT